jgi:hypothetical protein
MMNIQQTSIDDVKARLLDTHGATTARMLSDINRLQKDLATLGVSPEVEPAIRMPYSSMPNIVSRCWK